MNGGSSSGNPSTYNMKSPDIKINTATKSGVDFLGWTGSSDLSSGLDGYTSSNPFTANSRDHILGNNFSVDSGEKYRIFVTGKRTAGAANLQGGIWYTEFSSGAGYDGYGGEFRKIEEYSNGYAKYYKEITVPTGKTKGKFYVQIEQDSTGGSTSWSLYDMHVIKAENNEVSSGLGGYTVSSPYTASSRDHILGNEFSVVSGAKYRVFVTGKSLSGSLELQGSIWYTEQSSGNAWDSYGGVFTKIEDLSNGYAKYYKEITVPAGRTKGKLYIQLEQDFSGGSASWSLYDMKVVKLENVAILPSGSTGNKVYTANWFDVVPPSAVTISYSGGSNTCSWKNNYKLVLSATDTGSGVDHYESDGNGDGVADFTLSSPWSPWDGFSSCTQRFRAVDKAGNVGPWSEGQHIHMDITAPSQTTINLNGYTSNTINNGNVTITPSATDNVAVAKYQYSHDGANWADWPTGTAGWTITWNGSWNFWLRAVDHAGNIGAASGMVTVIIDKPFYVNSPSVNATSLADSVSQAYDGATIQLLRNFTDTSGGGISKNLTFNFDNYTLTRNASITVSGASVAFNAGSGGVTNTNSSYTIYANSTGSRVTINSGTYSNTGSYPAFTNFGQSIITGGTFTTNNANVIQNGNSSNNIGLLWIQGGKFVANGNSNGSSAIRNFSDQRWPSDENGSYIHYCTQYCSIHITGAASITANDGKDGVHNDTTSGNGRIHFPQAFNGGVYSTSGYGASAVNGKISFNGSTLKASSKSKLRNNSTRVTFGSNAYCKVGSTTKLCNNF